MSSGLGWLLDSTFLCQLADEDQELALAAMEWRASGPDEVLVREGERARGVDLIVSGEVAVVAALGGESPRTIARLGPGQMVGERSLFLGAPANASVRTLSPLRTLHLPAARFHELVARLPTLASYVESLIRFRERSGGVLDLLLRNPLLRALGREDLERLIRSGRMRAFAAGERIISRGDRSRSAFALIRGRVSVYSSGEGEARELLASEGPGWFFGHVAALLEGPRTADVEASEPCEVLEIPASSLMDVVARSPNVGRKLHQDLARMGRNVAWKGTLPPSEVIALAPSRPGLGLSTLALGLAAVLAKDRAVVLVDLQGPRTARRLGLELRTTRRGGVAVVEAQAPAEWGFEIVWPAERGQLAALLAGLSGGRERRTILLASSAEARLVPEELALIETLVHLRLGTDRSSEEAVRRGQGHVTAIRVTPQAIPDVELVPHQVRVLDDPATLNAFARTRDIGSLIDTSRLFGRACWRLSRILQGRSVGLAFGGGVALGFAHFGLVRALEEAGIPIDYVAGTSAGAITGAYYVSGANVFVDEIFKMRKKVLYAFIGAFLNPESMQGTIYREYGQKLLGETEVPFFPVTCEILSGRQYIQPRGTLAQAAALSASLPGAIASSVVGGVRLVDGGIVNNVPASVVWEAGAHFIIASNIIPTAQHESPRPFGKLGGLPLPAVRRIEEVMRSLFLFMAQTGRDRAMLADYVFNLQPHGFSFFDFMEAHEICRAGYAQARAEIEEIAAAYRRKTSGRDLSLLGRRT